MNDFCIFFSTFVVTAINIIPMIIKDSFFLLYDYVFFFHERHNQ